MISLRHKQMEDIHFSAVIRKMQPCSPYGAARLKAQQPFLPGEEAALFQELLNIEKAQAALSRYPDECARLRRVFMQVKDLTRTMEKCREHPLGEIELFELKRYLLQLEDAAPLFAAINRTAGFHDIAITAVTEALDLLDPEKNRIASFHISARHSPALAEIRRRKKDIEERMRHGGSEELSARRTDIAAEEEQEEHVVMTALSEKLCEFLDTMLKNAVSIGHLDLLFEKAALAAAYGGCMPENAPAGHVELLEMTNPVFVDLLKEQNKAFTPVTIVLDTGATVITGANMGGKSSALKTCALNVLLYAYGYFPFAKSARLCLFDDMLILGQDLEDHSRGLSSFGGEVLAFLDIIKRLETGMCMVMMDEFSKGTNPEEGSKIAYAAAKYLNKKNVVALMTTHYDNVPAAASRHYQVKGLMDMDFDALKRQISSLPEENPVELISRQMNYGLFPVTGSHECPRDAVNICRLLGMPDEILDDC